MFWRVQMAPYKTEFPDEEEDEWDTKNGLRIMAISYMADNLEQATFGCLINGDGECADHIRLEHILKRKNAWKEMDRLGQWCQFYQSCLMSFSNGHVCSVTDRPRSTSFKAHWDQCVGIAGIRF